MLFSIVALFVIVFGCFSPSFLVSARSSGVAPASDQDVAGSVASGRTDRELSDRTSFSGLGPILESFSLVRMRNKSAVFCVPYKAGSSQHRFEAVAVTSGMTLHDVEHNSATGNPGAWMHQRYREEVSMASFSRENFDKLMNSTVYKAMVVRDPFDRWLSLFFDKVLRIGRWRSGTRSGSSFTAPLASLPRLDELSPETVVPKTETMASLVPEETAYVSFTSVTEGLVACASGMMSSQAPGRAEDANSPASTQRNWVRRESWCPRRSMDPHILSAATVCRPDLIDYDDILTLESRTAFRDMWIKAGMKELVAPSLGCLLDDPPCSHPLHNPSSALLPLSLLDRFRTPHLLSLIAKAFAADYKLGNYTLPPIEEDPTVHREGGEGGGGSGSTAAGMLRKRSHTTTEDRLMRRRQRRRPRGSG